MASNKFEYPNSASATHTLTFTHGHLIEDTIAVMFNETTELSKGGTRLVESFGNAKYQFPFTAIMPISSETETDYTDVLAFFIATNGAVSTFTWTDESSVVRTVRMITGSMTFENIGTYRKITVLLEVV
jgi:hypothetical protein